MVTGVNGQEVTTGIIGKIKMEVVTGKMVWMEKTAGKMKMKVVMMSGVMKVMTGCIVKVMAGPIMKMNGVGLIMNGEIIGTMENGEMIALIVNGIQNGEMIGTMDGIIIMMLVMIMILRHGGIVVGETIGGIVPAIGGTVKVTGVIMKELTTGGIMKTKMEAATGKMVWMMKTAGKMKVVMMIIGVQKKKTIHIHANINIQLSI